MGQNLYVLLLYSGHDDLGFVGFAQRWDPFFFFFSGTVDDTTFFSTSNNHMDNGGNTILFKVTG